MLGLAWHEGEKIELFEGGGWGKIVFIDQTK